MEEEFGPKIMLMGRGLHSVLLYRTCEIIAYTQRVVHDTKEYMWLMADHPLGGEGYVGGKKLTISDVTWRVIIPSQSNVDWERLRSSIGDHKGRIEYALMENSSNIKAGIALNEKIAGLTFPDVIDRHDL